MENAVFNARNCSRNGNWSFAYDSNPLIKVPSFMFSTFIFGNCASFLRSETETVSSLFAIFPVKNPNRISAVTPTVILSFRFVPIIALQNLKYKNGLNEPSTRNATQRSSNITSRRISAMSSVCFKPFFFCNLPYNLTGSGVAPITAVRMIPA